MGRLVDLNCDLGESYGVWTMGDDAQILPWISSANVACGFHGGDPQIMAGTVAAAAALGVAVGAHPSFPDRVGFGRRNLDVTPDEARTDVLYQIGALAGFCRRAGVPLQHVKPHGQLNNLAMTHRALAEAIVAGIADFDPGLVVVAYGGELARAAQAKGLRVAYEAFADRAYHADGTLVSRREPGAVITETEQVVDRAIALATEGRVTTVEGTVLTLPVHTLCVHGDTPGAAGLVAEIRTGLSQAGIAVVPLGEIV